MIPLITTSGGRDFRKKYSVSCLRIQSSYYFIPHHPSLQLQCPGKKNRKKKPVKDGKLPFQVQPAILVIFIARVFDAGKEKMELI
jgi:hypothetical protein